MLVKHFRHRDHFYKFLKETLGIFFKEAEERAFEGVFHCIYTVYNGPSELLFLSARKSGVHLFFKDNKYVLCGSEANLRKFCSELVKYRQTKTLAREIVESLMRYRKESFRLQYRGKILPLGLKTVIMGILNVTPDSFSNDGYYKNPDTALKRAVQMKEEGAEIIDIGGESTRPDSQRISAKEELSRVLPVLKAVRRELPHVWISVDTYKSEVAKICLEEGADIVNDISGGTFDEKMFNTVSSYRCPYVLTHIKGRPETWKKQPLVYDDVVGDIIRWFEERIKILQKEGYNTDENLILDPGIGFGKTPEQNVEILNRFEEFKKLGKPLLVGVSRKSFIGVILEEFLNKKTAPKERLAGSLGALAPAVLGGAKIVRVHDVKETREFLAVLDAVRTYNGF